MLRAGLGKNAAQIGLLPGRLVHLFVEVSGEALFADTAHLSDAGIPGHTSLRGRLHNHKLPCRKKSDQAVTGAPQNQEQCKTLSHPYSFVTGDDVPESLGNFYTSGFYAEGSRAMCAVSLFASSKPASFVSRHSYAVANVKRSAEVVFGVPVDDNFSGKKVAVCRPDLQTHRREYAWLTLFQVDEVQSPLRVVSQKH